jgi:hypothetical protein
MIGLYEYMEVMWKFMRMKIIYFRAMMCSFYPGGGGGGIILLKTVIFRAKTMIFFMEGRMEQG